MHEVMQMVESIDLKNDFRINRWSEEQKRAIEVFKTLSKDNLTMIDESMRNLSDLDDQLRNHIQAVKQLRRDLQHEKKDLEQERYCLAAERKRVKRLYQEVMQLKDDLLSGDYEDYGGECGGSCVDPAPPVDVEIDPEPVKKPLFAKPAKAKAKKKKAKKKKTKRRMP